MPIKRLTKSELNAIARAAEIATECYDLFNDEDGKELAEKLIAFGNKYADETATTEAAK